MIDNNQRDLFMDIKFTNDQAKMPSKGSIGAAGLDLYSCQNGIILPQQRQLINIGIQLQIPDGYYGRIAPRSGLALKNGIDVMAGVIDQDYRGDIKVILYNSDNLKNFEYKIGDKIAQIIIEKYYNPFIIINNQLNSSERNDGGFGSTDNNLLQN